MQLYFFGDSICFGQFVSPNKVWVTKIAQWMQDNIDPDAMVQNPSVNGRTTRQALEDMPYHLQSHKPGVVYIQYGMNDCNCWQTDNGVPRVSPEAFRANISEMIERARLAGAHTIFLGTNHPSLKPGEDTEKYENYNQAYNEITRSIAKREDVILVDHESNWRAKIDVKAHLSDYLLPDGIHLSERGHGLYFDMVVAALTKKLG